MAKSAIIRLLQSPNKEKNQTTGVGGILAGLWRQILFDLDISYNQWNVLMTDHLTDPANNIEQNNRAQISERGNMVNELAKPSMTWRLFIKALRFLKVRGLDIQLTLRHANGKKTIHTRSVDFGRPGAPGEMRDDEASDS
jgi:hypothetical protein